MGISAFFWGAILIIFFMTFYILPEKHPQIQLLSPLIPFFSACLSVCFLSAQELERFKSFVKRKPTFDVVIDGLNVANINKDKSRQSETVWKHAAAHAATNTIFKLNGSTQKSDCVIVTSWFMWFLPMCVLVQPRGFSVSCRMTNAAAHMSRSA